MTVQTKNRVSLVTHSETNDQGDYNSADSGVFNPGPPLSIEDCPLTGESTPQNLIGITGVHTSKSKLEFNVPFNSQGHIGTGPQHCHLWDSNLQR